MKSYFIQSITPYANTICNTEMNNWFEGKHKKELN